MHPAAVTPADVWTAWRPDPTILVGAAVAGCAYARGLRRLWSDGRVGRGSSPWHAAAFGAGLIALLAALVSPLDAMAEALLSAHMVQHLLLVLVAAPLLVLADPAVPLLLALPGPWRRRLRRWGRRPWARAAGEAATAPVASWLMAVAVLWAWHLPPLYQAALRNDLLHAAEHLSLLATGILFWWVALRARPRGRLARGGAILYVFTGGLQGGALGALLTFAPAALYPIYGGTVAAWGLTPLEDQQLAGLIMWIPFGTVYLAAAAGLFLRWMAEMERAAGEADPPRQEAPALEPREVGR